MNRSYLIRFITLLLCSYLGFVENSFILYMQADNQQYADEYRIHTLLGEGGQASVFLGSKDNQLFALKLYQPGANKVEAFKIEVDLLSKLHHPNLINMVAYRPEAKVRIEGRSLEIKPMIVLELAQGGELFEYISKLKAFTPEVCRAYTKQILNGIKYLVSVGITHRDLKPQNVLFDRNFQLKISDFGLSRDAKGDLGDYRLRSRVGTQGYKPPEMELGNYQGLQADFFSTGVLLFIMYNGSLPFLSTKSHDRIYKHIRDKNFQRFWAMHEKNKPKDYYPDSFKRLMNSFFSAEPDRRPTFESLENDEWMKGDEAMENDIFEYMSKKAAKIAETDPNKQKIAAIRQKMFQDKLDEDNCGDGGSRFGGVEDLTQLSEAQLFVYNYQGLAIKTEELQEKSLKNVIYVKNQPAFVVAWLQSYLNEQLKAKNSFMTDFIEDIVPTKFALQVSEKGTIKIFLQFQIDEEDQTELRIVGQLHRKDKEVGVEWTEATGNSYWVSNVITSLNDTLAELK